MLNSTSSLAEHSRPSQFLIRSRILGVILGSAILLAYPLGCSSSSGSGSSTTNKEPPASGGNTCGQAEMGLIESCVPLYQQQGSSLCQAVAQCANNEVRADLSNGCRSCLGDVVTTCGSTASGSLACPCCL